MVLWSTGAYMFLCTRVRVRIVYMYFLCFCEIGFKINKHLFNYYSGTQVCYLKLANEYKLVKQCI